MGLYLGSGPCLAIVGMLLLITFVLGRWFYVAETWGGFVGGLAVVM